MTGSFPCCGGGCPSWGIRHHRGWVTPGKPTLICPFIADQPFWKSSMKLGSDRNPFPTQADRGTGWPQPLPRR